MYRRGIAATLFFFSHAIASYFKRRDFISPDGSMPRSLQIDAFIRLPSIGGGYEAAREISSENCASDQLMSSRLRNMVDR